MLKKRKKQKLGRKQIKKERAREEKNEKDGKEK